MRLPAILLLLVLTQAAAAKEPPAAVDPTPEETLMLELLNRARADPAAEGERIARDSRRLKYWWAERVDWDLFVAEMKKVEPVPPVFFHPALLEAARNHTAYLAKHFQGGTSAHPEVPGLEGFTGEDDDARAAAAGYPSDVVQECCGFTEDIDEAHCRFTVDYSSKDPSGMQPKRLHRVILFSDHPDDFGFAAGGTSTLLMGSRKSVRQVGGVVFADRDGDRFYDVGEGRGGVKLSVEGSGSVTSTTSGAYVLSLRQGSTLRAEWDGLVYTREFPAGAESTKIDIARPSPAVLSKLDRLAGKAKTAPKLLELMVRAEELCLDDGRRERIEKVIAPTVIEYEAARAEVRTLLAAEDPKAAGRRLREIVKVYGKTAVGPWFKDAEMCAKLRARPNAKAIASTRKKLNTAEWREWLAELAEGAE